MRRTLLIIWIVLVSFSWIANGQEIYRWVDEKGTIHFADDLTLVPEKYRGQLEKRKPSEKPSPLPARPSIESPTDRPTADPISEKRDLLGRGEAWWRAKMKEWNDKLQSAQTNIDLLSSDLRQKEKELAEAKFKSNFIKRKLRGEIKNIQIRLKEQERMRDEAKNMMEKILPKEAEDFRADPDWLKPKD